jgi:hypothetical protein
MLLAIIIISGLSMLHMLFNKFDLPTGMTAIFIIACWNEYFVLAIIGLCLAGLVLIRGIVKARE